MPHSPNTVEALLLKVAEGDEYAFGQLFKIYHNQLGAFILRITESETLTKEIVQDVFMKIWINRRKLAEVQCFKAYLFVIARNYAFNCLKQIAREKNRKARWLNSILPDTTDDVEETRINNAFKLIDEAVELLPPQQKKVYTLSRRYAMKQSDIANEMNISLETVKKHIVLALQFIKSHLRTRIDISIVLIASLLQF